MKESTLDDSWPHDRQRHSVSSLPPNRSCAKVTSLALCGGVGWASYTPPAPSPQQAFLPCDSPALATAERDSLQASVSCSLNWSSKNFRNSEQSCWCPGRNHGGLSAANSSVTSTAGLCHKKMLMESWSNNNLLTQSPSKNYLTFNKQQT